MTHSLYYPVFT